MNDLVEQMVMDISRQALRLDATRLHLFLNWLNDHVEKVNWIPDSDKKVGTPGRVDILLPPSVEQRLASDLEACLAPQAGSDLLQEYRLILDEIGWWRDLDEERLRILVDEVRSVMEKAG